MNNEVVALGYVVVTAEDLDAWSTFATSILGLQVGTQPSAAPERETLYLRADERSWRIAVEAGPNGGVGALGFEVSTKRAFDQLKARLTDGGIAVKDAPEVAAHRRVLDLFQAEDPNGVPLEFYYGAKTEKENFVSPRGARFVTGSQGVGHAVIFGGDGEETYEFYATQLGFRVSDVITMGPASLTFTSPNPRHHSFAFAGMPGMPPTLAHIMLQVEDIDTVGRALDRVYDNKVPLQSGLGRHTNDQMLSFYCLSPSGLAIEYGWGGL
ncbi:MAG: hypothetical protein QOC92_4158, partial [Acidimicrobiaceae bacterium]